MRILFSIFLVITLAGVAELCSSRPVGGCAICRERKSTDIQYKLFTRISSNSYETMTMSDPTYVRLRIVGTRFNFNHPTIIYVHGYSETFDGDSATALRKAYHKRGDYNFIVADWSALVLSPWYFAAASNAHYMGRQLAKFVELLYRRGVRESDLHVIGFSLGAEAAGFAGKVLKRKGLTLARITGLDPALPEFETSKYQLSRGDALFVDIIHTDPGWFGVPDANGDVDFYPNPEYWFQPGCRLDHLLRSEVPFRNYMGCSHNRAWKLYAESVGNPKGFPATHNKDFKYCCWSTDGYMGYAATSSMSGAMYLATYSNPPFARNGP